MSSELTNSQFEPHRRVIFKELPSFRTLTTPPSIIRRLNFLKLTFKEVVDFVVWAGGEVAFVRSWRNEAGK